MATIIPNFDSKTGSEIPDFYEPAIQEQLSEPKPKASAASDVETPQPVSTARLSLAATENLDGPKAVELRNLAKELKVPEGIVFADHEMAKREKTARDMEMESLVVEWAREDVINAAIAKTEPQRLAGVIKAIKEFDNQGVDLSDSIFPETLPPSPAMEPVSESLGDVRGRPLQTVKSEGRDLELNFSGALRMIYDFPAQVFSAPFKALSKTDFGKMTEETWQAGELGREKTSLGWKYRKNPSPENLKMIEENRKKMILAGGNIFGIQAPSTFENPPAPDSQLYVIENRGKFVLLPSIDADGNSISMEQAWQKFQADQQHYGIFDNETGMQSFLSMPAEDQAQINQTWNRNKESSYLGLRTALEQLPRMLKDQLPTQAKWSFGGASAGVGAAALAGIAGPQALIPEEPLTYTIGAGVGGRLGWLAGSALASYEAEAGSFAAEMALEKDINGNPIPHDLLEAASDVYGLSAAGIETFGEALFLKFLAPAGMTATKGGKQAVAGFIRKALLDPSKRSLLLNTMLALAGQGITEGLEETAQATTEVLTKYAAQGVSESFYSGDWPDVDIQWLDDKEEIRESGQAGFAAGLWLAGGPTIATRVYNRQKFIDERIFYDRQQALFKLLSEVEAKGYAPDAVQTFVEKAAPETEANVDLDSGMLLVLQQDGMDILAPLGLNEADVQKHAEMGQTTPVQLSRVHSFLSSDQFNGIKDYMKEDPDALNRAEVRNSAENIEAEMQKASALYEDQQRERSAYKDAILRLRDETAQAIQQSRQLNVDANIHAKGAEDVASDFMRFHVGFAQRNFQTVPERINYMNRISVQRGQARGGLQQSLQEDRNAVVARTLTRR